MSDRYPLFNHGGYRELRDQKLQVMQLKREVMIMRRDLADALRESSVLRHEMSAVKKDIARLNER